MAATDPKKCMTCKEPMQQSVGSIDMTYAVMPTTVWSCHSCGTRRWDSIFEHQERMKAQEAVLCVS